MTELPRILALGNSVVDIVHEPGTMALDERIKNDFFKTLPSLLPAGTLPEAPRAGDNIMVESSALMSAAQDFLKIKGSSHALSMIFGRSQISAGGSLANTVAAIAHSTAKGNNLADITYLTAQDEGTAGDIFRSSLPQGVVQGPVKGECMKVHVVPTDGDRIIVAAPHAHNGTDQISLTADLDRLWDRQTDYLMIEGFLAFGPHFDDLSRRILDKIDIMNGQRAEDQKPPVHVVLTASSHGVCNKPSFREFFNTLAGKTPLTVHANTGEFRRLLARDEQWRAEFDSQNGHPFSGLSGRDLESAKKENAAYQMAKAEANREIFAAIAFPLIEKSQHPLRFVVTNGKHPAHVIDKDGIQPFSPPPLDPARIVNTVGAGDAFMAGFWTAQLCGGSTQDSMKAASLFAQAAITQAPARLSGNPADLIRNSMPHLLLSGPR